MGMTFEVRGGAKMTKDLTSPDGTTITVPPIEPEELDRIVLRCWPDRETLDRLFAKQGTIGMAAFRASSPGQGNTGGSGS
jgi:hypothetical protein